MVITVNRFLPSELMTTFCKTLKTLLLNRPFSRKLLRGDNLVGGELGRWNATAKRSHSTSPNPIVEGSFTRRDAYGTTKTQSEAMCCREKST